MARAGGAPPAGHGGLHDILPVIGALGPAHQIVQLDGRLGLRAVDTANATGVPVIQWRSMAQKMQEYLPPKLRHNGRRVAKSLTSTRKTLKAQVLGTAEDLEKSGLPNLAVGARI